MPKSLKCNDYRNLDGKSSYIPFSADILKQLWVLHERALVDYEGYRELGKALHEHKSGRQPLLVSASSPIVLLNIQLIEDIVDEHKRSCVCYEGMKYIGWILEQYEPSELSNLPNIPTHAMNEAYLDGKILPAYVGSEKIALEPFHKAYNLVINVAKKATSKAS